MLQQLFCNHDYDKISETILESPYDQLVKAGQTPSQVDNVSSFFHKVLVVFLKCTKCKKTIVKKIGNARGTILRLQKY